MTIDHRQRVLSNYKQQSRLSYKRREVLRLANAIDDEMRAADIRLPRTYVDYQDVKEKLLANAGYDVDQDFMKRWDMHWDELIKLQYKLRHTNKAVYALFENKNQVVKPMLVSMWYTKHRMDEVWLMRKSQLIRSIYREYLTTATVPGGGLLIKTYTPAHLVLTVPHNDQGFKGEKFYLKSLLALFHELRRCKEWKKCVYGGEYGAEIKKSNNGNGLHIHIHSLIFINHNSTLNAFRAWIKKRWKKITGSKDDSWIWLEQLYTYKRDEQGKVIMHQKRAYDEAAKDYYDVWKVGYDEDGEVMPEPHLVRKKFRVGVDSPIEDYLQGVMECIKYHFKSDTYKTDDGYDIDLIRDILNNSRNVRFYSRYGAFYKCKELNFTKHEDENKDEAIETDSDEVPNGSAIRGVNNLINPFTFEPASINDYDFAIAAPEELKYASGKDLVPYHLKQYGTKEFKRVVKGVDINEVIRSLVLGKLQPLMVKERDHVAWYDRRTLFKNTT